MRHRPDRGADAKLGAERSDWAADLLSGEGHGAKRSVERDIVAGPADIDKLDYLLRDSHFCGVNYGRYDLDKLIESARLMTRTEGGLPGLPSRRGIRGRGDAAGQVSHAPSGLRPQDPVGDRPHAGAGDTARSRGGGTARRSVQAETLDGDFVEEYLRWVSLSATDLDQLRWTAEARMPVHLRDDRPVT
ncbi:MAG TPA: hypothetical protein VK390_14215 [Propionibacteriaceae bacterium]|nr:hypothetical protein [Propionibacteriaceae bacterium]